MDNFNVSPNSIIRELLEENKRLALEAATLRAGIVDIQSQSEELSDISNVSKIENVQKEI